MQTDEETTYLRIKFKNGEMCGVHIQSHNEARRAALAGLIIDPETRASFRSFIAEAETRLADAENFVARMAAEVEKKQGGMP